MMKKPRYKLKFVLIITFTISVLYSCTEGEGIVNPIENSFSNSHGRVQLYFPIEDRNVPLRCIRKADISIAFTADSLYRKEYVTVANMSDYQDLYEFVLEPGIYYYQAAKICICGRDTCLWGGYPGGQNGMLWTMSSFEISRGEIIYDHLKFDK